MGVKWTPLSLGGRCAVRDLWQHKDLRNSDGGCSVAVRPHGAALQDPPLGVRRQSAQIDQEDGIDGL
jgi:hypothetical protein